MRDLDRRNRLDFAYYFQNHADGYSNFLSKIVFTDECMFCLNGHVNLQMFEFGEQRGLLKIIEYLCTVPDYGMVR